MSTRRSTLRVVTRLLALASGCVLIPALPAAADIGGLYIGYYVCAQRYIPLKLAIVVQPDGSLGAVFGFQPPGGAPGGVKETAYAMRGRFTPATGAFELLPDRWVTVAPLGYTMVGVHGTYEARTDSLQARIANASCTSLDVKKDPQQSAQLGQQMSAQQERVRNLPPSAVTTTQFPDTCTAILTWASKVEVEYPGADFYGGRVGSSRVDLQACKLEYSIVSPK